MDRDLVIALANKLYADGIRLYSKSDMQIQKIVVHKLNVPISEMWNNESVDKLFNPRFDRIQNWMYKYVRDNQEQFTGHSSAG